MTILREWTAAYGPLLLILDDFDRADALSWTFLARMAEEIDMAVLVVAAIRPNDGIFATPGLGQARCLLCTPSLCLARSLPESPEADLLKIENAACRPGALPAMHALTINSQVAA